MNISSDFLQENQCEFGISPSHLLLKTFHPSFDIFILEYSNLLCVFLLCIINHYYACFFLF